MDAKAPSISAITRLLELAARSLHSAGFADGLYPAQWTALRYLANAAPSDRTSAKLARFQQMAIGPVMRTVRTLITKGYVVEAGFAGHHHRSKRIDLNEAGIDLLKRDPLIAVYLGGEPKLQPSPAICQGAGGGECAKVGDRARPDAL